MTELEKREQPRSAEFTMTPVAGEVAGPTSLRQDLAVQPNEAELPGKHCCAGGVEAAADSGIALSGAASGVATEELATPLFTHHEAQEFLDRWATIQGTFVDDPRHTVEAADGLVEVTMKRLAEVFAEERAKLERQWESDKTVSTEDLRLALRRYRSFFGRLLAV